MRLLIVLSLFLSAEAFAQRVKENVKQATVLEGSRAVINSFEVQEVKPAPAPSPQGQGQKDRRNRKGN